MKMKAILVIDMPNKCGDCRLCYKDNFDEDSWFTYRCKESDDKVDYENIYEDCPLKPLPERFEPTIMTDYCLGNADGWNACLDEILGGTE